MAAILCHSAKGAATGADTRQSARFGYRIGAARGPEFSAGTRPATGCGALPPDGSLVRGAFTEADSGRAMRRAVIGFGSGKTEMEVQVEVSDLASPRPTESFLVFGTITDPSRLPGGAVTRNPYVVAAKFVLEKGAPRRDVEHTAQAIADELAKFRERVRRGQVTLPATR
jgi:hypothetical protein